MRLTAAGMPTSRRAASDRNQRCSRISWNSSAGSRLPRSSTGTCRDRRLEALGQPAVGDDRLGRAGALARRAERGEVVEQAARLVLLHVEAGQRVQPAAVVARLDDLRVEPQAPAARIADELDLLDVEAELVEAAQALVDAVGLVGPEHVLARQLGPQRLVAARHLGGRLDRIQARGQADLRRLEIEQLARPRSPRRPAGRARAGPG